jgi:hypothetical protein
VQKGRPVLAERPIVTLADSPVGEHTASREFLTSASREGKKTTASHDQARQTRARERTRYADYEERLGPIARTVPYRMEEDR